EQRGKHLVHRLEHLSLAAHVEEALLLAGERGLGQILGGRRGAYRHGHITARAHALELRAHRRRQGGRKGGGQNPLADTRSGRGEPRHVIDVELGELGADARLQPTLFERSEEHTSELQSQSNLVCRLLLEKKKSSASRVCNAGAGSCKCSMTWE